MTSSYLSPTSPNRHIMNVIHPCRSLAYHEDRPTKPTDFDLVINLVLGYLTDKPKDRQILSVCQHRQNRQFLT